MKRITVMFLVLICLIAFANPIQATPDGDTVDINILSNITSEKIELDAQGAVLMALDNGEILFSKDENKRLYPASTTKILTGLLALEYGDLEEIVTVGNEANLCAYDSSIAGVDIGEEISLENLLYGLMLPSGNDAAYVIAVHIGRKIKGDSNVSIDEALGAFVNLMNRRSRELGVAHSNFMNPDGYHHDDHYTTARDLALITREAMNHDVFRQIISTEMFTIPDWSSMHDPKAEEKEIRYWRNTNALIQPKNKFYYPDATGGKTGYTSNARHCLVAIASRDGTGLLTVVLGNTTKDSKWIDSVMLLDYGYDNFVRYQPFSQDEQVHILDITGNPDPDWVRVLMDKTPTRFVSRDQIGKISKEIQWEPEVAVNVEDNRNTISLPGPVSRRQKVGTMIFRLGNTVLDRVDLVTAKAVEIRKPEKSKFPVKLRDGVEASYLTLWYNLSIWQKFALGSGIFVLVIFALAMRTIAVKRRRGRYVFRRR
ncbi:MAG TPA: D-alanyl-D-alanine carboxypeptidase family protein [Clostridia bacterium]|nr:D-alanyl-D-alanine carboxypeptidase family protein [Clostridia bacterium]